MSDGFSGLIRDSYSDYFLNSANALSDKKELFGDLGSVYSGGKFLLGGYFPTDNFSASAFVGLDNLRSTTSNQYTSYGTSSSFSTETTNQKYSPHQYNISFSVAKPVSEDKRIGILYQYVNIDNISRTDRISTSTSSSYRSNSARYSDYSTNGNIHKVEFGLTSASENHELDVRLRGLLSSYDLTNSYDNTTYSFSGTSSSKYFQRQHIPSTVDAEGVFILVGCGSSSSENNYTKYVSEIGYTSYELSGTRLNYDSSGSQSKQTGVHSTKGKIWDLKFGAGFEHHLSEWFTLFFGPSIAYLSNTFDNIDYRKRYSKSGSTTDSSTQSQSSNKKLVSYALRFPIGVEYTLNEYVYFRGGLEPMYLKGKRYNSSYSNTSYYYTSQRSDYEREEDGLSLSANSGVTFQHQDYGELNIMLGNILTDMKYWSFSMRYWL